MVMNPPYDERLEVDDVNLLYKEIGRTLKEKYQGYKVWIISSNSEAFKYIGLKPSDNLKLYNGKLECQYCRYDIFENSYDTEEIVEEDTKKEAEKETSFENTPIQKTKRVGFSRPSN